MNMQRKIICRYGSIALLCINYAAYADYHFNPAFLASDPDAVADLSHFDAGAGMAPGQYKVDVYVNGNFSSARQISFVSRKVKGSTNEELKPVFSIEQLAAMGVRTDTVPELRNHKPSDIPQYP